MICAKVVYLFSHDAYMHASFAFYAKRDARVSQLFQQPDVITTSVDEVSSNAKPLVKQIRKIPKRIKKLIEMIPHQEVCCSARA